MLELECIWKNKCFPFQCPDSSFVVRALNKDSVIYGFWYWLLVATNSMIESPTVTTTQKVATKFDKHNVTKWNFVKVAHQCKKQYVI